MRCGTLLGLKAPPHAGQSKVKISVHLLRSLWLKQVNAQSNMRLRPKDADNSDAHQLDLALLCSKWIQNNELRTYIVFFFSFYSYQVDIYYY